jgi:predicted metal-dependent phosphoesterase TrpH
MERIGWKPHAHTNASDGPSNAGGICGIEVPVKYAGKSVHLLGYFVDAPPRRGSAIG